MVSPAKYPPACRRATIFAEVSDPHFSQIFYCSSLVKNTYEKCGPTDRRTMTSVTH